MKFINLRMLKAFVVAASLAAFSGPAQAVLIGGTDVGSLDTVIGAVDSATSGQTYEENKLEAAILAATGTSVDVTLLTNVNHPTMVSEGGNNYIDVSPSTPGYYLLKFGTGNSGNDMFFMSNNGFLQFLAWSDAQLIAAGLPANHVDSIGHYAIAGNTTSVPEPSTLLLLGSGLVVLAITARRLPAFVNR